MVNVCDDVDISNLSMDDEEAQFHAIIGSIEDILMEDSFLEIHTHFMNKYWREFEDTEENKFVYTDIFHEYIGTIEKHLEEELTKRVGNFKMSSLEEHLQKRKNELDGEVFEILATFSDFSAFKTMFLDYRNMMEGKSVDFSSDLCISKYIVQDTAL